VLPYARVAGTYPRTTALPKITCREPMNPPEEFRRNADECVRLAKETTNPEHRASLLSMAQSWRQLANIREARLPDKES
jgi:hypothetical protein